MPQYIVYPQTLRSDTLYIYKKRYVDGALGYALQDSHGVEIYNSPSINSVLQYRISHYFNKGLYPNSTMECWDEFSNSIASVTLITDRLIEYVRCSNNVIISHELGKYLITTIGSNENMSISWRTTLDAAYRHAFNIADYINRNRTIGIRTSVFPSLGTEEYYLLKYKKQIQEHLNEPHRDGNAQPTGTAPEETRAPSPAETREILNNLAVNSAPYTEGINWYNLNTGIVPPPRTPISFKVKTFNHNPTDITSRKDLKNLWNYVLLKPSTKKAEAFINNMCSYYIWRKHGDSYLNTQLYDGVESFCDFLKRKTSIEFTIPANNILLIVHPNNIVQCIIDDNNTVKPVTKDWFRREGDTCNRCCKAFNAGLLTCLDAVPAPHCSSCLTSLGYYRCSTCRGQYHLESEGCPYYNEMSLSHIYNYSQDVRAVIPKMYAMASDKTNNGTFLRYGVELEVLVNENISLGSMAKKVGPSFKNHAIMKYDSSLGNNGLEIVTVPATLEYHKQVLWSKFFDELDADGRAPSKYTRSWDTSCCGLHIHLTKDAVDKMQLAKFITFYHELGNTDFLSKIAGRLVGKDARYCFTRTKKLGATVRKNAEGSISRDIITFAQSSEHHGAVTISSRNKGKTAEVRIFRGNATRHGIIRALEFVDATLLWCSENGATELGWRQFLDWFKTARIRSRYPELRKQLINLGFIAPRKKSKTGVDYDLVSDDKKTA